MTPGTWTSKMEEDKLKITGVIRYHCLGDGYGVQSLNLVGDRLLNLHLPAAAHAVGSLLGGFGDTLFLFSSCCLTMVSPLFALSLYVWKNIFLVFSSNLKHLQAMLLAVCLTSTFFSIRLILMSARSMVREAYHQAYSQALGEKQRKKILLLTVCVSPEPWQQRKTTVIEIKFYIPDKARYSAYSLNISHICI